MNLRLPMLGRGSQGWTAFDVSPDGSIAAVCLRTSGAGRKPQVLRCAHSSDRIIATAALEHLASKVSGVGYPCTLALSRGDYQMLVLPEPPVLDSEMEASLRWSLASMIEFPVDEAVVAWMRIPTAEFQPGREKQVYVIVARSSVANEQAALFEKARLPLRAIDVRETALRNVAALLEKKGEGIGLLTMGPSGITTTFTYRGELYLDRFIAQPLGEVANADEQWQQKLFDRVAQQVYQSMELITRSYPFISIERIVTGPMPELPGMPALLAGKLPVPVQALNLASIFDLAAVPELARPENQARYLVALGAALRGMRKIA